MVNRTKENTEDSGARRKHILVVDDDKSICRLAERLLALAGYDVTTCVSGVQAIDIYSTNREDIHLVILDMVMPEMSGLETFHKLKVIDATVRVILCSAFTPDINCYDHIKAGFLAYITKPFDVTDFLATIDHHVN